jgi:hypothetical protein
MLVNTTGALNGSPQARLIAPYSATPAPYLDLQSVLVHILSTSERQDPPKRSRLTRSPSDSVITPHRSACSHPAVLKAIDLHGCKEYNNDGNISNVVSRVESMGGPDAAQYRRFITTRMPSHRTGFVDRLPYAIPMG